MIVAKRAGAAQDSNHSCISSMPSLIMEDMKGGNTYYGNNNY